MMGADLAQRWAERCTTAIRAMVDADQRAGVASAA